MHVVIQCAATKCPEAGTFRTADGRWVAFVADPAAAPSAPDTLYAHPDDLSDQPSATWRQRVEAENAPGGANSWGLLPAGDLYRPRIYRALVERYGRERVFILSAGWGLVRADWLLPTYDIALSSSAEAHHRRRGVDGYQDWVSSNLQQATGPDVVFLGGRAYLPLFERLTARYGGRRLVFFPQVGPKAAAPTTSGCTTQAYITSQRTNWHYACAEALLDGRIAPDFSAA